MDNEAKKIRARETQRRWRAANREKHRASVRAWRLANLDKAREKDRRAKERMRAKRRMAREVRRLANTEIRAAAKEASREAKRRKARDHYLANRERILERGRKWREANRDKCMALQKAWRDRNQDRRRADKRVRKAAKRITLVRELTRLQRGRCAYCRVRLGNEFHVDHVMPLKRGGPDRRSNLQLACVDCNQSKAARDPVEFARSIGRLL